MSLETDKRFLFKSTLYNLLGTAFKVVAPALMIVIARIFGKEEFGIFVSTQLWMQTLSRVAAFGLDKGLNWFLPQNILNNRPANLGFNESLNRSVFAAIIIFIGLAVYTLASASTIDLYIYALSIVPWVAIHIYGGAAEGIRRPQYKVFVTDCTIYALAPLISIALHFAEFKHSLPIGLLSANIAGCVIYYILLHKEFPVSLKNFKNKIPRELLVYSIPRGFSEVISAFLMRGDLWMVLWLLGPAEAGVYAVMVTISNGLKTIRQSYSPILLPVVAGMNKDRLNADLKSVFSYCVSMATFIQLVIGFFIVLFPDKILLIAGKDFIVQPETLGILLFAHLFGSFFLMSATVLNGIGKSLYTLKMDAISLGLVFAVNYICIPIFGLPGAALSTLAFILLQSIWNNIYLFKLNLRLYSKKVIPYALWSVFLLAFYVLLPNFSFELWEKIVFYIVVLCGLILTKMRDKA